MVRMSDILRDSGGPPDESNSRTASPTATSECTEEMERAAEKSPLKLSDILSVDDLLRENEEKGIGDLLSPEELRHRASGILRERAENIPLDGEWASGDVNQIYEASKEQLQAAMTQGKAGQPIPIQQIAECTVRMVNSLLTSDRLYLKAVYNRHSSTDLLSHSVNVAIFAIKIGTGLQYNEHQLIRLGTVGLLHDVGMAKLPAALINKESVLTKAEYQEMQRHPEYSYEMLSTLGPRYEWIASVVRQEHERINGNGYPRRLAATDIHEYAQIVGLVDYYEALTHTRPQRRRFLPYDAVKIIVEQERGVFAPRLLKTLLRKISVFPLEGFVKLNTSEVGKVIETSEERPLRPTVEILYDGDGKKLKASRVIRLKDTPLIYITGSVYEEDILGIQSGWNLRASAQHHQTPQV